MFPHNWSKERIMEEVAWVYENTVHRGQGKLLKKPDDKFDRFQGKSTAGFDILIEIDKDGNIMNSYPVI